MATPNLGLAHIAAAQDQKEVTANAAFDGLDEALCGTLPVTVPDADVTLTTSQALSALAIIATGTLTANRKIIVPTNTKLYLVANQTTGGFPVTLTTASGTGFAVSATDGYRLTYCDGKNINHVT
jgi:hypothetical protein